MAKVEISTDSSSVVSPNRLFCQHYLHVIYFCRSIVSEKCLHNLCTLFLRLKEHFFKIPRIWLKNVIFLNKSHNRKCFSKSQTSHIQSIAEGDRHMCFVNGLQWS